mmetsp:Transcript_16284/g.36461  ORF Transcript_16284/g.36461 Transcript_16284/m.36461 type:complete len:134 (-) Transcript_16284:984-1385(-)
MTSAPSATTASVMTMTAAVQRSLESSRTAGGAVDVLCIPNAWTTGCSSRAHQQDASFVGLAGRKSSPTTCQARRAAACSTPFGYWQLGIWDQGWRSLSLSICLQYSYILESCDPSEERVGCRATTSVTLGSRE